MASFIGIVPADNPKYIIYVLLDDLDKNSYGGRLAAPVFQEIAQRSMAYSGDLPDVIFASESDTLSGESLKTKPQKQQKIKHGVVPDVTKLSLKRAMEIFNEFGQLPEIIGSGMYVVKQEPPAGTQIIIQDENKNEKIINHTYKLYLSLPKEPEKDQAAADEANAADTNDKTGQANTAPATNTKGTKK